MRPLSIELKGFGAFRDHTQIDLTDIELVALVGATGSGKSTIIDAITFALYGSVARYDDNKRVAYVVNQVSAEARVLLRFELNGAEYVAVRVVRRTKKGATTKEARLERGDTVIADSARDMSKAVHELLGLDVGQFNRTVVLPQGRFADFLHDDPADRQATLRQLLGLDIYQRIGQAARSRSATMSAQLELLRSELSDDSADLTHERRAQLVATLEAVGAAREAFGETRQRHTDLVARHTELTAEVAAIEAESNALASVVVPDGVGELADRERAAAKELQAVLDRLAEAIRHRQVARAAVDDGPDLAAVTLQLNQYEQLASVSERRTALMVEVGRVAEQSVAAAAAADVVRSGQAELDQLADQARAREKRAAEAVSQAPSFPQLDAWSAAHAAVASFERDVADARIAAGRARAPIAERETASARADHELTEALAALTAARDRHGVAAFAHLLASGEPCPLCLNEVADLPQHHHDDEVAAAELRRAAAAEAVARRGAELADAIQASQRADAHLAAATTAAARAAAALDGVPSAVEIDQMRTAATRLLDELDAATAATEAALVDATTHRDDADHRAAVALATDLSANVTQLRGQLAAVDEQVADFTAVLSGAPSRDDCIEQRARGQQLQADLDAAEQIVVAREGERDASERLHRDVTAEVRTARRELSAARDCVATLSPPPIDDLDLAEGWVTLDTWCAEQQSQRNTRFDEARAETQSTTTQLADLVAGARAAACDATAGDASDLPIEQLGEFYAGHESTSRAALDRFDTDLAKVADARARIGQLEADEAVARKLGSLLRADAFEAWFMQSALRQLVERATERLFELSGGQYSLIVDDNQFLVRDHTNADETRSTRTLSGGETFLASLSLALALSEATAELAPEGAPHIESIFLDEGFGTLDPGTLDTVAAAIEELGASGRMVGIVTHIRELADRMPVRLEVTKSAGTATVQRVEA